MDLETLIQFMKQVIMDSGIRKCIAGEMTEGQMDTSQWENEALENLFSEGGRKLYFRSE